MCFESLSSPAVYLAPSSVLSVFSTGCTTGLVVDMGAAGTSISPVVDGYEMRRASVFTSRGGDLIDRMLLEEMRASAQGPLRPWYEVTAAMRLSHREGSRGVDGVSSPMDGQQQLPVPMHQSFREMHLYDLARDLKQFMCFVPYTPIVIPPSLMQRANIDNANAAASSRGTVAAVAAAASAAVSGVSRAVGGEASSAAASTAAAAAAAAVSKYREEELVRRSLRFPPPYELPDGTLIQSGDRICTVPERVLFYSHISNQVAAIAEAAAGAVRGHPIPSPVLPPPAGKGKKAQAMAAAAAASAAATVAEATAVQANAVAGAVVSAAIGCSSSRKRARLLLDTPNEDSVPHTGSSGGGGLGHSQSSAFNAAGDVDYSIAFDSSPAHPHGGGSSSSGRKLVDLRDLRGFQAEEESLSDLVYAAVAHCDVDVRRELLANIHLVGGSSLITGVRERLAYELNELVPTHLKVSAWRRGPLSLGTHGMSGCSMWGAPCPLAHTGCHRGPCPLLPSTMGCDVT